MTPTRVAALALTTLTGGSALVYEVCFERYLATLLGSHSEATAAVLGLFLGGLSLGYALFGRLSRGLVLRARRTGGSSRLLVAYGVVEAGIGLHALCFPWLFRATRALSPLGPSGSDAASFAFDVALCALLILPATVLMGGTIPLLTQALSRNTEDASRLHASVYAFNTAGAFAGALAAGFALIPTLGLVGTMAWMGCLNLLAGSVFLVLGLGRGDLVSLATPPAARAPGVEGLWTYLLVAFLSGAAMMALQTVVIRLGALSFGASQFTFSMVVAVFVLCIALGGFAVSALPRLPPALLPLGQWGLVVLLYALYPQLENAPYGAHVLRTLFRDHDAAFYPYHVAAFAALLAALGPTLLLSGALLPLLFHHLRREVGELGAVAGRLYSWNTLGSLVGALGGGYAALFWLDLHHVFRLAIAAVAGGAALLTVRVLRVHPLAAGALFLAPVWLALALLEPWDPDRLSRGLFRFRQPQATSYQGPDAFFFGRLDRSARIVRQDDDPVATVTVREYGRAPDTSRSLYVNGKSDGSSRSDYPTMGLLATLPALFADRLERAFVIGFGLGVTAGELASLDGSPEVLVAEISPGVVDAAPLFDFANQGVSRNPRIRIVRSDAYRALLHAEGGFDVIVSEPSNPWVTGVEMLYSLEFLQAARGRLRPGGVYAQWFHEYATSPEALALVLRTFAAVFEEVAVWYGLGTDLILIGFPARSESLDPGELERRFRRTDLYRSFARSGVESFPELLAHELVPPGVLRRLRLPGPVHSLYHPRLSHAAARAFFAGARARLPWSGGGPAGRAGREESLWRRYLGSLAAEGREPAFEAFAQELCANRMRECISALADWQRERPGSARLAGVVAELEQAPAVDGTRFEQHRVQELLGTFYGAREGGVHLTRARRASELFRSHYFHGAPLPPRALLELWERCEGRREECRAGLEEARRLVGA